MTANDPAALLRVQPLHTPGIGTPPMGTGPDHGARG